MALNLDSVGKKIGPVSKDYTWKDAILYALGVGAGFSELEYTYEKDLKVIPTFSIASIFDFLSHIGINAEVNLAGILHGEQDLIFHNPIPPDGKLITESLNEYTRKAVRKEYASLDDFLRRWSSAEKKQVLFEELESQGVLLDALAEEVGKKQGKEFYTGVPQDGYPDVLDKYRKEMAGHHWDVGEDEEELFEFAMHEAQYRDYKSGIAKTRFGNELTKAIELANSAKLAMQPLPEALKTEPEKPRTPVDADMREILSPAKGRIYYNLFDEQSEYSTPGDQVSPGNRLCYIETNAYIDEIISPYTGQVVECMIQQGASVKKGQLLFTIKEIKNEPKKKARVKKG